MAEQREPVRRRVAFKIIKLGMDSRQTDVGKLVHQLQGDPDWIVLKCLEKDRTRR